MVWDKCHCPSKIKEEIIFDLGGMRIKNSIRCQISRSKTRYIVFQHKLLFKTVKDLFKWIDVLGRSFTVQINSEGVRNSDLGGLRNKNLIRCQTLSSKTRFIVFQHKLLFNLVKDLLKWIDGLGRSVAVWVRSESERVFVLVGYEKRTWCVVKFRAQKLAV